MAQQFHFYVFPQEKQKYMWKKHYVRIFMAAENDNSPNVHK